MTDAPGPRNPEHGDGQRPLVVLTRTISAGEAARLTERLSDEDPLLLRVSTDVDWSALPESWERIEAGELLDPDVFRQEFLAFLEAVGDVRAAGGQCLTRYLRTWSGYSVWWTGPGAERQPDMSVAAEMRAIWLVARALDARGIRQLTAYTHSPRLNASLRSLCDSRGVRWDHYTDARETRPARRMMWLITSWIATLLAPLVFLVHALLARLLAGGTSRPNTSKAPTVVMTCGFPRHVRLRDGRPVLTYWGELREALGRMAPEVRLLVLPMTNRERVGRHRMIGPFCHTAWPMLRDIAGLAPLPNRFPSLRRWLVSLGHHLRTLNRYARIEASREFRNALHFCGADVSALYLPIARQHVMLLAPWEMGTAAVATSLRRCGDVRAVLVNCEFYRSGMVAIGAARQEGLTTMGVQHGTIMPMHLIYTPPEGHVLEAPTPDRFAAYSTYARDIVSGCGDYPAERVWVTGAPSLDELATRPSWKRQAREQLDLPCDQSVVLVTTQEYSWFRPAVEAIVRCLTERDDVMLCIKTHPREGSGQGYRQLAKRFRATNVRVFEENFDALLEACDVICSGSSTTLLEGIVRGRPAVCLNFSGEPDRYPYVDHGGALPGRTPEQLHRSLERALEGDANGELERAREQFLQRHVGPARRGQAAEELARRVLELAGIAPEA